MRALSLVELVWVTLNTVTLALTIHALADARADRRAVRLLDGRAREMAADGAVRREQLRVVVQVLLLIAVIPGVFFLPSWITIVALMAVPAMLLANSLLDARDRRALIAALAEEINHDTETSIERLEGKIDANTAKILDAQNHEDRAV